MDLITWKGMMVGLDPTGGILLVGGLLLLAWFGSSMIVLFIGQLGRLTNKTSTTLDDVLLQALRRPIHFGFQLAAICLAVWTIMPAKGFLADSYERFVLAAIAGWVGYTLVRIISRLLDWQYGQGIDVDGQERRGAFRFLHTMSALIVWGGVLTFVLNQFGVNVSALLAGLGIAGLAVALALQNTLSGVFAAVFLAIDRPIRQGDYVVLENGVEGFVEDISIRATRIKTFQNTIVVVPNARLMEMSITNHFLPQNEVVLQVPMGIAYDSDLSLAEQSAIEVAKNVLHAQGAEGGKEPFVRFKSFDDSSIGMSVFLPVGDFMDQYVVRHEFIKALVTAFSKEGIEIPFPQLDIHQKKKV